MTNGKHAGQINPEDPGMGRRKGQERQETKRQRGEEQRNRERGRKREGRETRVVVIGVGWRL